MRGRKSSRGAVVQKPRGETDIRAKRVGENLLVARLKTLAVIDSCLFNRKTGAQAEKIARGCRLKPKKIEGVDIRTGGGARGQPGRRTERGWVKQQGAASGKDRQAAECGRNGRRGDTNRR